MKLLWFHLFEDSDQLKAYRKTLVDELYKDMKTACENSSKKRFRGPRLARIPFANRLRGKVEENHFIIHLEWKRIKKCHIFGEKKYCYHTGKELIVYEKTMAE